MGCSNVLAKGSKRMFPKINLIKILFSHTSKSGKGEADMIKLGRGIWRHAEALKSTNWCSLKAITRIPNFLRYREIPLYSLASMLPLWRFTWSKKDTIGHHSSVDLQPPFGKHVSREVSFCRLGTFPCHPNMEMTIASRPLLHIEHTNSLRRIPAPKIFFSEYYLSSQLG
jgi:hypothetical protein